MRIDWLGVVIKRVALVSALVGLIAVPGFAKTGTDLMVTDVEGVVVLVSKACVDYGGNIRTFGVNYEECAGIRIKQGVANVTLMWNRVVKLALLPETKDGLKAEVTLIDGRVTTVNLVGGRVIGGTDLGYYEISLKQVRTIEPVNNDDEVKTPSK